ncbi:hypothetical protein HK097_009830 [Rhizophlyctis rosea]|uniref:Uncharacterized protein n=1 Tax=Rhizophlyctis rosea TaxID=64517 RepID=A0AAD5S8C7_9FUNG|nr:hypothetical protein HK097_009830 [Rhizophlyctis rosea]
MSDTHVFPREYKYWDSATPTPPSFDLGDHAGKALGFGLVGGLICLGIISYWHYRRRVNKRLKDPTYLPSYIETITLRGQRAPVRIDIPDMPPPEYDVEAQRDMVAHVPIWMLDEGGCCENHQNIQGRRPNDLDHTENDEAGPCRSLELEAHDEGTDVKDTDDGMEGAEEVKLEELPSVGLSKPELGYKELAYNTGNSTHILTVGKDEVRVLALYDSNSLQANDAKDLETAKWGPPPEYD